MKKTIFSVAVLVAISITAAATNRWHDATTADKFPSWPKTESVAKFPTEKFPVINFPGLPFKKFPSWPAL